MLLHVSTFKMSSSWSLLCLAKITYIFSGLSKMKLLKYKMIYFNKILIVQRNKRFCIICKRCWCGLACLLFNWAGKATSSTALAYTATTQNLLNRCTINILLKFIISYFNNFILLRPENLYVILARHTELHEDDILNAETCRSMLFVIIVFDIIVQSLVKL